MSLRHSWDYKYISDSNSLLIFIACLKVHCSYTEKKKRYILFLIACKSFLIYFSLPLQGKHLSKSRKKIQSGLVFLIPLFSFFIHLFCFSFNKNVSDLVQPFKVHRRQVLFTNQADEVLMHKIHFHYHLTVFHNVVSSH